MCILSPYSKAQLLGRFCNFLVKSPNFGTPYYTYYFDFQKAFDTIKHDLILKKLKNQFSINGCLLRFISNYLKDRSQRVVLENCYSAFKPVNSGVPQGSILGPLLFLLFINDISEGLDHKTNISLYADYTKLWREMSSERDCTILQFDIDKLYQKPKSLVVWVGET